MKLLKLVIILGLLILCLPSIAVISLLSGPIWIFCFVFSKSRRDKFLKVLLNFYRKLGTQFKNYTAIDLDKIKIEKLYLISFVTILIALLSPIGDRLQAVFDKTILPYLDYPSNIWLTILAILFLFLAILHNYDRYKSKSLLSDNWIFLLCVLDVILILYYLKGSYSYALLNEKVPFLSYVFCFFLISNFYLFTALFNMYKALSVKEDIKSIPILNPGKPINQDGIVDGYAYKEYIESIAPSIIANFDEDVSMSLGISGAWGSGKTSFLYALQRVINEDDRVKSNERIVIEFKPWFCEKKTDLVQEFFKVYREHMGSRISGFDSDIMEYAKVLTENIDKLKWVNQVMKLCTPVESKQKQFGAITDKLKRYKIPVYIIIDDLDRLDAKEIMEILRLIRITANFPYTQFILAYDKPYIQKAIQNGLSYNESERFIHKIINSEIALPYFDYSAIGRAIFRELSGCSDHSDVMEDYLTQWGYYKSQNITDATKMYERVLSKLLPTFRDVYRFVNMFKLDYEYFRLKSDKVNDYIDFKDYFTLSVIKYSFFDFYSIMKDDSHKLFEVGYYISLIEERPYSKEIDDQSKSLNNWAKQEYEKKIKFFNSAISGHGDAAFEYLIPLLKALFEVNDHNENSHHCIRRRRAYNQYFQFKTIDYIIYKDELASFINGGNVDGLLNKINKLIIDENVQSTKSEFSDILSDLFISYLKEDNSDMLESIIQFTDNALQHTNVKKSEIIYAYADYFNAENSFDADLWLKAVEILLTEKYNLDSMSWQILLPKIISAKDRSTKDDYKIRLKNELLKSSNGELIVALYESILDKIILRDNFLLDPEEINEIQMNILERIFNRTKSLSKISYYSSFIKELIFKDDNLLDGSRYSNKAKPFVRGKILDNSADYIENFMSKSESNSEYTRSIYPMVYSGNVLSRTDVEFIFMKEKGNNVPNYEKSLRLWNWIKKTGQDYYQYEDLTQTKTVDQWIAEGMPGLK